MDIAAQGSPNFSGGLFELFLDGVVQDSHGFGFIDGIERATLSATVAVTAGLHELKIQMTRPFGRTATTPFQYVDNVAVAVIPEPGTLALFGLGAAGLATLKRGRRRKKTARPKNAH